MNISPILNDKKFAQIYNNILKFIDKDKDKDKDKVKVYYNNLEFTILLSKNLIEGMDISVDFLIGLNKTKIKETTNGLISITSNLSMGLSFNIITDYLVKEDFEDSYNPYLNFLYRFYEKFLNFDHIMNLVFHVTEMLTNEEDKVKFNITNSIIKDFDRQRKHIINYLIDTKRINIGKYERRLDNNNEVVKTMLVYYNNLKFRINERTFPKMFNLDTITPDFNIIIGNTREYENIEKIEKNRSYDESVVTYFFNDSFKLLNKIYSKH